MSSTSSTAGQFDETGFKLVRDVLRSAGLRGVDSAASSDVKRDASIFLTAEFRGGVRTLKGLTESLNRRDLSSKKDAIDRWRDDGGH